MANSNIKKAMALILALSMCSGLISVPAMATEITEGTVEVETTAGNKEPVNVTVTIEKTENADGSTTVDTTEKAKNFKTEDGMKVNYESTSSMTTDKNGVTTGEAETDYTSQKGKYTAAGGSELTIEKDAPEGVTVKVPLEEGTTNTVEGDKAGTITLDPNSKDTTIEDGKYDYTTETVKEQGSVTVTTTEITITDTVDVKNDIISDLIPVTSATEPTNLNDLYKEEGSAAPVPAEGDGYQFVSGNGYQFEYMGSGNTSQFRPAVVFTEPLTREQKVEQYGDDPRNGAYIFYGENGKDENGTTYHTSTFVNWLDTEYKSTVAKDENGKWVTDEAGYILDIYGNRVLKNEQTVVGPDGKTYYLHRFDANGVNNYVEGWYQDGKWVEELNGSAEINESTGKPVSPIKVQKVDKDGNPVLDSEGNPVYVTVTTGYKTYKDENNKTVYMVDEDGNILVSYGAVWAGAQQFVLVDKETGEVVTTYCADIATKTEKNFGYNIVNLEDSTYYDDAQAEQIRTIAANGYWGTTGTETDEEGNTVPKAGSLDAMKQMLLASGQFTEDELASLNDGVALSATQMAIWSCSNHMAGAEFVNTNYVDTQYTTGYVPQDKEDETKLMFKIYEYLTGLKPTEIEKPTTENTIINADNFLKDMSVTVIEKAEDHENNKNESDKDDAYVTDLSFALVVTPSTDNGDDLVVKVVDAYGNVLASGRVAGTNDEGEDYQDLVADANGNYSFKNIVMTEGEQNFNLTLEGIQNLKEGVYLYTSEIDTKDNENPDDDRSSQTMVGMASGKREVGVSMNLKFELSVEDEVVATEHVWRTERTKSTPPTPPVEPPVDPNEPPVDPVEPPLDIPEDPTPLDPVPPVDPEIPDDIPTTDIPVEIPENIPTTDIPVEIPDETPLTDVPKTGDISALWYGLTLLSGGGLMGLLTGRKGKDEQ